MHEAVVIQNVTKLYRTVLGKPKTLAVNDVSFSIHPGEIFSLLGPNGAGKTTLIKILCGLLLPSGGHVTIFGQDAIAYRKKYTSALGVVLQGNRSMYWRLSARENLAYFGRIWGLLDRRTLQTRSDELLEFFGLTQFQNEPVSDFSRGMQQKLAIALALINNPRLLLLDEPTLGLDVDMTIEIKTLIRRLTAERQMTVLLTTHQLNIAEELSDRVAIIAGGKLLAIDTIHNLKILFETAWYQFTVLGELDQSLSTDPLTPLVNYEYNPTQNQTTFTYQLNDPTLFYVIIDRLQHQKATIITAAKVEPNLEEIFLRLTRQEVRDAV
jgi:ABC-2 type transport system ATP-binding protein